MSKKVTAKYSKSRTSVTRALYQYDYGQTLMLEGEEFSDVIEMHFSNEGDKKTTVVFGDSRRGFRIPDDYLKTGKDIQAWAYSHTRACDGESVYNIIIPVMARGSVEDTSDETPIVYVFDGGDSSYDETSPCSPNEYLFEGGDSERD